MSDIIFVPAPSASSTRDEQNSFYLSLMAGTAPENVLQLRRVLNLKDLIIFGLILIQPVASLPLFGHANDLSRGHAVSAILVSMIGMVFTAISYGRMANLFPAAGSAYTYVSKSLHPYIGFIAGWSMFLDYLLLPIICVIYCAITASHLFGIVPYTAWLVIFSLLFTALNLRGVKMAARTNGLLMIVMAVVVFWFMGAAILYVSHRDGVAGLLSSRPFYDRQIFSWRPMASASALAALTYIGFDGITTLAEEVRNPRRNILLATVLVCVITGLWSGAQVYLAQLSWPDWQGLTRGLSPAAKNSALDTAILTIARRVGGSPLDFGLTLVLLVASIGSGVAGALGASRLLFGMGRDGIISRRFFGHLDKRYATPTYNILLIGGITLASTMFFDYEECAQLINFGAFLAFMGVNIGSMREYFFRKPEKTVRSLLVDFMPPFVGFCICLFIWLNLPLRTFIVGGSWMAAGVVYLGVQSRGFRADTEVIGFS
ncbi:MAG TPA: APC family permease [Puia sp.]|nr:APC family permease [Puia sp.]